MHDAIWELVTYYCYKNYFMHGCAIKMPFVSKNENLRADLVMLRNWFKLICPWIK